MLRSQKHPVVLEKRYAKVLSQWGCHAATEMSRVVSHMGVQLANNVTSAKPFQNLLPRYKLDIRDSVHVKYMPNNTLNHPQYVGGWSLHAPYMPSTPTYALRPYTRLSHTLYSAVAQPMPRPARRRA